MTEYTKHTVVALIAFTIALVVSLCLLILWSFLGTGASLAWFSDTSPELNNIFHAAEFDLKVYKRLTDGSWKEIGSQTEIFDENAVYEPGYVQIVYLKIHNNGTIPFNFYTAVNVNGGNSVPNIFGTPISLQDHLKFGITISPDEDTMKNSIPDRAAANRVANMKLHNYSTDTAKLDAGCSSYIALVLRMPEEVGNVANYRGNTMPTVELGLTVKAEQIVK